MLTLFLFRLLDKSKQDYINILVQVGEFFSV